MNQEQMKRLAELRQKKAFTMQKTAHKPVALRDPDVMLYMIDPKNNNSKFYEMKIVPHGEESRAKKEEDVSRGLPAFVLMRRWGRLTDSTSTGRVDSHNVTFSNYAAADNLMQDLKRQKTRKGYKDVSMTQKYPIGLGGAGFGWGGQAACRYVPQLKDLANQVLLMQRTLSSFESVLRGLDRSESSIVSELVPLRRDVEIALLKMSKFLNEQLSECRDTQRQAARKLAGCVAPSWQKVIVLTKYSDFALQTVPTDHPYCQTYETELLAGPATAQVLAKEIGEEFRDQLSRMDLFKARKFVDEEIKKRSKRPISPRWHYYVSPD